MSSDLGGSTDKACMNQGRGGPGSAFIFTQGIRHPPAMRLYFRSHKRIMFLRNPVGEHGSRERVSFERALP